MTAQLHKTKEPIPGYTIQERLGAGGYGEVWKAIAPGEIEKAIKFIYGYHDEERAARELRALNRIKEVRHPFLLSLDRIEVIDGQLVIVTELADKSLKDRFLECIHTGLRGIPRGELLIYLRDAADALDYMSEQCSLQHLDVKPENLLLVGGRVKVADFGLVKDIHDATASLMGGLTPVYAPPEVFGGRPGMQSDQYSLAIVYVEMLTSHLPFRGTTAAQLMAQHLHDRPDLSALGRPDRSTVARALSKNPHERFHNCRALVDSLLAVKDAYHEPAAGVAREAQVQADSERGGTMVTPREGAGAARAPQPSTSTLQSISPAGETLGEVTLLPPVEVQASEIELRPALFVGIGGTAARTLKRLRRRLHDRFGDVAKVPAFRMLLLETDLKSVLRATEGGEGTALDASETLTMPLRRTQDYRCDTASFPRWLSRRWLYNIPRSLQPEGRRPLGRLALVDHSQRLMERLRDALSAITERQTVAMSAEKTGLPFSIHSPRVILIASISGGTGSGMVLDVAYAVRTVLAELGLSDDGVCGVLTHSTARSAESRDLAIANSYACLTELRHFSHPSLAFPGAPECGIPAFGEKDATFPHVYLVHLGNDLTENQFDAATDQLAEYVYLDAVTSVGVWLDKCRNLDLTEETSRTSASRLRTFGLCQVGGSGSDIPATMTDLLCSQLIRRWSGDTRDESNQPAEIPFELASLELAGSGQCVPNKVDIDQQASHRARELRLDVDCLLQEIRAILRQQLKSDEDAYYRKLGEKLTGELESRQPLASGQPQKKLEFLASLDGILGPRDSSGEREKTHGVSLQASADPDCRKLALNRADAVRQWICQRINTPRQRLAAACRAADWFTNHTRSLEIALREMLENNRHELQTARGTIGQTQVADRSRTRPWHESRYDEQQPFWMDRSFTEYFQLKLCENALVAAIKIIQLFAVEVWKMVDKLRNLQREFNHLASQFEATGASGGQTTAPAASSNGLVDVHHWLRSALRARLPRLADELEEKFDTQIVCQQGGLSSALASGNHQPQKLIATLHAEARAVVLKALREISVADLVRKNHTDQQQDHEHLQTWLQSATPPLLVCGGAKRLLVVSQEGAATPHLLEMIQLETGEAPSTVFDADGDLVFCCEVEQISYGNVAASLTNYRQDYPHIASRLHTRIDVGWVPLVHTG